MRPGSSLGSGRTTPQLTSRTSIPDLKRPGTSRSYRPLSPRAPPRSRPGSSLGSRPSTPSFRPDPYTGTIKVSVRPNPYTDTARVKNWTIEDYSNTITNVADSTSYSFDNVFPSEGVSNRHVYDKSCAHLVDSFLNGGYNCTLFAYGMTGSGKTYSMRGEDHDPGFVRLAIDDIFGKIDGDHVTKKRSLSVSYLEIYNEKIIDLLSSNGPNVLVDLKIRDDPEFGTRIVGVNTPAILSKEHLTQLIRLGDTKRKTSATDYNARSSRSHAILQLRLHTVDLMLNTEVHCTLSLCDLAGSERATSSVERMKEGAFINKSLLALSTVINKLSLMSSSPAYMEHIPYRDSKLTRLLQPALSGASLILILCTVHLGSNQSAVNQQLVTETYNTLRFAARAKDIVMTVKSNQKSVGSGDSQKIIDELRATIEEQKLQISKLKLQSRTPNPNNNSSLVSELRAELIVQNEKIEHLTRLNELQKTETILLRNDAFNDILGVDVNKALLQMMMSNLEEFCKRVNYEMEEYKGYISLLENQLKDAHQQLSMQQGLGQQPVKSVRNFSDKHYEEVMKEQEEEIWQLKETIKDKDHIIHGLTKTSKLRRLVDFNSALDKRPSLLSSDKENLFPEIRDFNLSPKHS